MIPTAEEWFSQENVTNIVKEKHCSLQEAVTQRGIEFAKLHVKASLKKAHENARIKIQDGSLVIAYGHSCNGNHKNGEIDKHSITNAYPLTNIK